MQDVFDRLKDALADRYVIERELGSGGMATVYLAEDLKHHRKVAVKVLRPELAAVLGAERFLKEIEVTANLQHPHILPLHDSGEADNFLYYVMPFVEGESLRDKLNRERQLSVEESIDITKAVASALDYAHRHEVIHRDIKPENILLHDEQALVADFGIALAISAAGGTRLTETGLSLGTPHYMSPEQATADRELDARSDVYSLAATLYEMLVGRPPFEAASAQAVVAKILTEEPAQVTAERHTVPPHVEATIHKALAKLPADRFATASQFAEALTNPSAAVVSPIAATPSAGVRALPRFVMRPRWLGWAVPLGLAVLAGAAAWGWLRQTTSQRAALVRFAIPFPESVSSVRAGGNWVALSRDGTHIAYVGVGDRGQQIYLRPMDQLEARPIPGTEGGGQPFFSHDGQWIGFTDGDRLRRVRVGGGPPSTIVEHPEMRGATWGADGMIVLGSPSGLWRVSAGGATPEQLSKTIVDRGSVGHRRPELLPGGAGVLFTIWNGVLEEAQVAVLSLRTGEVTPLFRGNTPRYSETGHVIYGRADGVLMAVPFDRVHLEVTGQELSILEGIMVKPSGITEFGLSRSGSLVYLTGEASRGTIVLVDRQGEEQSLIDRPDAFNSPRFSPNGSLLSFAIGQRTSGQVWIHEIAQGTSMPLTFEGNNGYPVWSWDGERVAFASDRGGNVDIFWKPANGSGVAEPLITVDHQQRPACFSRDGRFLIYRETHTRTGRDLWVLPLEGDQQPWAFTNTPLHAEIAPALSPDGRWLAYVSDLSGIREVYVTAFPGSDGIRQVSVEGGTEPVWSRDGSELFYRHGLALMVAAVETTPDFRVRSRQALFEGLYVQWFWHSNYDVHPDGERFVMIKPAEEESSRLVVVLNWSEELRRRAEPAGRD